MDSVQSSLLAPRFLTRRQVLGSGAGALVFASQRHGISGQTPIATNDSDLDMAAFALRGDDFPEGYDIEWMAGYLGVSEQLFVKPDEIPEYGVSRIYYDELSEPQRRLRMRFYIWECATPDDGERLATLISDPVTQLDRVNIAGESTAIDPGSGRGFVRSRSADPEVGQSVVMVQTNSTLVVVIETGNASFISWDAYMNEGPGDPIATEELIAQNSAALAGVGKRIDLVRAGTSPTGANLAWRNQLINSTAWSVIDQIKGEWYRPFRPLSSDQNIYADLAPHYLGGFERWAMMGPTLEDQFPGVSLRIDEYDDADSAMQVLELARSNLSTLSPSPRQWEFNIRTLEAGAELLGVDDIVTWSVPIDVNGGTDEAGVIFVIGPQLFGVDVSKYPVGSTSAGDSALAIARIQVTCQDQCRNVRIVPGLFD